MSRRAYVGIIKNSKWDVKTLILAWNPEDAKVRVMEKFTEAFGKTYREEDVRIVPFADWD